MAVKGLKESVEKGIHVCLRWIMSPSLPTWAAIQMAEIASQQHFLNKNCVWGEKECVFL